MKKLVHMLLIATCALALCQLGLYSQSKENGAIEGKAVMTEGEPLPGVEITLSSPNMIGGTRVAVTDAKGHYRFVALPPGTYVLEAKLEGFSVRRQEDVRLSVAMTLTVDFKMETGKVEEKIVVQGVAPLVDVKDSQTAVSVLTQEMIQNIPNTQFVSGIVNLAPGVHGDSAFGASDNGIQYQIDGVDTSDPSCIPPMSSSTTESSRKPRSWESEHLPNTTGTAALCSTLSPRPAATSSRACSTPLSRPKT